MTWEDIGRKGNDTYERKSTKYYAGLIDQKYFTVAEHKKVHRKEKYDIRL